MGHENKVLVELWTVAGPNQPEARAPPATEYSSMTPGRVPVPPLLLDDTVLEPFLIGFNLKQEATL